VFVDDHKREMTEYSMAKAAGEMLCADLDRFGNGPRIVVSRLPALSTDQTATVVPIETGDPAQAMLPIVREMQKLIRKGAPSGHDS
jgi:hypothetical protein